MFPTMYTVPSSYVLKLFQIIKPAMKKKRTKKMTGNSENRISLCVLVMINGSTIIAKKKKQKKGTLEIKQLNQIAHSPA